MPQVVFDIEPGNVTAFIADPGWIVSHTYTVYGPLASGSTAFLYEGSLRIKDVGQCSYNLTNVPTFLS